MNARAPAGLFGTHHFSAPGICFIESISAQVSAIHITAHEA